MVSLLSETLRLLLLHRVPAVVVKVVTVVRVRKPLLLLGILFVFVQAQLFALFFQTGNLIRRENSLDGGVVESKLLEQGHEAHLIGQSRTRFIKFFVLLAPPETAQSDAA